VIGITNSRDLGHRFDGSAGAELSGTLVVATMVFPSSESVGAGTKTFWKTQTGLGVVNGK
jgi:sorbitol-specific phosphotransferase system component IIA